MTTDPLQRSLQTLAEQSAFTRAVAIFLANDLIVVMGLAFLVLAGRALMVRGVPDRAGVVRLGLTLVAAYLASKVLSGIIVDPRPYVVQHIQPMVHVAHDNGFPSDHTLLAASLAAMLWWVDRRAILYLASAVVLVMIGRLGIAAHHTVDVLGSTAIVVVAALAAAALPLPASLDRPILPPRTAA